MQIDIPKFCFILCIASDSDRAAAFAERTLPPDTAIVSADVTDLSPLRTHLDGRRMTVALASDPRAPEISDVLDLAREFHAASIALVLNDQIYDGRDASDFDNHTAKRLKAVHRLPHSGDISIRPIPLTGDHRHQEGPFDVIGDVHGCADELEQLLARLGYEVAWQDDPSRPVEVTPPPGRRLIFVGDLVDRGPRTPDVLRIVMAACRDGVGFTVLGNHDAKFQRWLNGNNVKLTHGLQASVEQMELEPQAFHEEVHEFMQTLEPYFWCDDGQLIIAHAGINEPLIGRNSRRVRRFCLYGDTSGERDAAGLPVRYHWAAHYTGEPAVVYGHTPVAEADWVNNTLCLDTGCCFGGRLTALSWPERTITWVPANDRYAERRRPFGHPPIRPQSPDSN